MPPRGVLEVIPPAGPVDGGIRLDGGKHAFAHALACAALADEGTLYHAPDHIDARALRAGLGLVFARVEYDPVHRTLSFGEPRDTRVVRIHAELAARSRSLLCLYPALLARARELQVEAAPQGCEIGPRPTGWYIRTLQKFGVVAEETAGELRLSWSQRRPAEIRFDYPTMTGTVIALAAAAAAPGTSTIANGSAEPSCADELDCLATMGARVEMSPHLMTVESPGRFASVRWSVPHDRIHAVTYLTAGLLVGGRVTVTGTGPLRIPRFIEFLQATGCRVIESESSLTAQPPETGPLQPVRLEVGSEPLFSSDWAPMAALLLSLRTAGRSELVDDVFPERFQYLDVLRTRGMAPFRLDGIVTETGRRAVRARIDGRPGSSLRAGALPTVPDIRGSAAIALAALAADGPSRVVDDFHIRRGYTDFAGDLRSLGLAVTRTAE